MIPIVSIVGDSDSGKTTLMEVLIREMKKLGLKVGTIKHDGHGETDREGKDSVRHAAAGAEVSAVASEERVAVFAARSGRSLEQMVDEHFSGMDIVLTEGFKGEKAPKVEVVRGGVSRRRHARPEEVIAVVTDGEAEGDVPVFGFGEAERLAGFLHGRFIEGVSRSDVRVWVDGEALEMKPFVRVFVGKTIKGMLSALREGRGERIRIKVGR